MKKASLWMYLPYCVPMAVAVFGAQLVFTNSSAIGYGFIALLAMVVLLEPILGEDNENYEWQFPNVFLGMMYLYAMGTFATFLGFLWVMGHAHNGGDLLSIAAATHAITGFDMLAVHANDGLLEYARATLLFSVTATIGTVSIGHELCHRTHEPLSVFFARAMGSLALFSYYAVEHPYGHHLTAGTPHDSSTALRGESVTTFFFRTFKQDYEIVWEIEKIRLEKLNQPLWSHHNSLLLGYAAEFLLILTVAALTGFVGLLFFAVAILNAHWGYKVGVYGQHYGLVRDPESPLEVHHSWGCTNKVTNWFVDGIGRHADHHLAPQREFWNLEPYREGPQYEFGYFKTMAIARRKKSWDKLMVPKLIEWDKNYATPEEKLLAMQANEKSGIPELIAHAKQQRQELEKAGLIAGAEAA
ncbi:MAG: hypothetical protein COB04_13485 [Gammaproteobacteria bacterium]|nr:MAG: hypothetical protein COB04_13485 [Gammaproteobacteria bacterium]